MKLTRPIDSGSGGSMSVITGCGVDDIACHVAAMGFKRASYGAKSCTLTLGNGA